MVTPELKWPMTNLTPSPTNLLATDTPCFGSDTSSPCSRVICWPRMPPALLMSSTACCVPLTSCAPKAAFGPVIGPATPILISALAAPENARAAASATPDNQYFFIRYTPMMFRALGPPESRPGGIKFRLGRAYFLVFEKESP